MRFCNIFILASCSNLGQNFICRDNMILCTSILTQGYNTLKHFGLWFEHVTCGPSILDCGWNILTWGMSIYANAWHLSLTYGTWFYLYYCLTLSVFHSLDNKEINFPSKVIKFFDWFCKEVDEFLHSYGMNQNLDSKIPKSNEIIYYYPFLSKQFLLIALQRCKTSLE